MFSTPSQKISDVSDRIGFQGEAKKNEKKISCPQRQGGEASPFNASNSIVHLPPNTIHTPPPTAAKKKNSNCTCKCGWGVLLQTG